ncbi:MAG: ISL3 family transposase [Burkholderiales bacterium]|jgi:transposase|nr:ISL3 family transposase [Burkholderiales bacterium]
MHYSEIKILDTKEYEAGFVVEATVRDKENYFCPYCESTKLKNHANKTISLRDAPYGNKPVLLIIQRYRLQCLNCTKTFYTPLSFIDERRHVTISCVKSILNASFKQSFVQVAQTHGVDEKTVRNIFNEYIASINDKVERQLPSVMGIDEVHLGGEYRCTISNLQENLLFDFLESRKKSSLTKFCEEYKDQLASVKLVCMDLWLPYKQMVKQNMPNAIIVADRFHVQRMATNALESARKHVRRGLTQREKLALKDDRKLILMNIERLDIKSMQRLMDLLDRFPLLKKLWAAKEQFNSFWDMETKNEASEIYQDFLASLDDEAKFYFKDLITAMQNWQAEIFNYFVYNRITNAATETLNREIGRKYDMGYGYSFASLRNKLLYTPQGADYSSGYSIQNIDKLISKGIRLDVANSVLNQILRYDHNKCNNYDELED